MDNRKKNEDKIMELGEQIAKLIQVTYHPHVTVIITCDHVEVVEGIKGQSVEVND